MSAPMDDQTFRRSVECLTALPIRPTVARQVFAILTDEPDPTLVVSTSAPFVAPPTAETDPAWALAGARVMLVEAIDPAAILIEHGWWLASATSSAGVEALTRLWRHSVAVGLAARRMARQAKATQSDRIWQAGLLHHLGLWAVAAVDPDRLAIWLAASPAGRAGLESRWFGVGVSSFGRRLAERWGCDPLVVDAVWLHADQSGSLNGCSADPVRLGLIQQAFAQAVRTPWALDPHPAGHSGSSDPDVRVLTAEVQSRCSAPFLDPDASSREEWLTRDNLRLRRDLTRTAAAGGSAARLVASLAESSSLDSPQTWADRAALAWCGEPGVVSARVLWRTEGEAFETAAETSPPPIDSSAGHPPTVIIPLGDPAHPVADVLIWTVPSGTRGLSPPPATIAGWNRWADVVADRERTTRLLDRVVAGHRGRIAHDEATRHRTALAALAEFAAGAGHEINNPLAVVMGRAQLLLSRSDDPETTRSLRAIITQAQRAHRILRDLMFVARPSDSRPRACQPDEIVRASLRDLQQEAEVQGVRLVLDLRDAPPKVWADPEPLRQVADILTRNALEASPTGATVRFSTGGDARNLRWVVHDSGRGISATEGEHLFDPFFCGRAAGRGLGLGLARAARIIDQAGGDIRWHSIPGQGATFQVNYPVAEIPGPIVSTRAEESSADRTDPA